MTPTKNDSSPIAQDLVTIVSTNEHRSEMGGGNDDNLISDMSSCVGETKNVIM